MPPDRGSTTRTQKSDSKREGSTSRTQKSDSKREGSTPRTKKSDTKRELSTSRNIKKTGDVSNGISKKDKPEARVSSNSLLARQKANVKKEENVTISPTAKGSKSSRIDAAKLKDVKKDINRDLRKVRETLARNRTIKNSPVKPTAARTSGSEKTSEGSISRRISNGLIGTKNVPGVPSSSKRGLQTSSSDLPKPVDSSSRTRLGRSVNRQESVSSKNKERHTSQDRQPKKLSRERTRTRTLSPHEIKTAQRISSLEVQKTQRSPKQTNDGVTAVPSVADLKRLEQTASNEEMGETYSLDDAADNYEDDFEDYESDFEEDVAGSSEGSGSIDEISSGGEHSSANESNASEGEEEEVLEMLNKPVVEEEKKLDSGNYDLTESKRKSGEVQQTKEIDPEPNGSKHKGKKIQEIKEALEKENASVSPRGATKNSFASNLTMAKDEGFEEEKSDESKISQGLKKTGIINFANAKKKMEEQKVTAKAKKRGEELLSMIRLDTVGFSLLDLPPVPYEVYMKSYGRSNTQQASVQTNEDNLSEEIQTEEILTSNKWTQHPVAYHPVFDKDDANASVLVYSQDHLGCGGNGNEDPEMWKKLIKYNAVRLNQFLLCAGQSILQHLEQQSFIQENNLLVNSTASYFSKGFFNLNVNSVPFLAGRSVSMLRFSDLHPTLLLTVHSQPNNSLEAVDAILGRCMLGIWNILKPSTPEKILVCSDNVSSVCFHQCVNNLVFAGLYEGTVCVWDIQEPAAVHCLGDRVADGWVIRSPTYSTAEILKSEGHLTEVTAICAVGSTFPESTTMTSDLGPIQVCSVDVSGVAIVWTIIQSTGTGLKTGLAQQDLGLAYWGKVRLVRSVVINIFEGLDLRNFFCHLC